MDRHPQGFRPTAIVQPQQAYLTAPEVAKRLGVCLETVVRARKRGEIGFGLVGLTYRAPPEAVDKWGRARRLIA